MEIIHLTPAQVAAGVQDRFSRDYWSVELHDDGGCDLIPCHTDAGVGALCGEDAWLDF